MRYGVKYRSRPKPITRFFSSRVARDNYALAMVLSGCKLPILYIKKDF